MGDRHCGDCTHFEPSQQQGRGRCLHPELRRLWKGRLIKRKAHACLSVGRDYWEAAGQSLHIMLGKILMERNKITRTQLETGLAVQETEGYRRRIGEIWIALDYVTPEDIREALQVQQDMLRISRG